jgi:BirA family biotin operon repressor/biotin-[acetyl-CoA-carboxylase] ligase
MAARAEPRPFTADAVQGLLRTRALGRALHLHPLVASTNTTALALAASDAPHGTVVVAEEQTAGRGRLGRVWHSPAGENLYCSVLLREVRTGPWLSWLPLVTGLAILKTAHAVANVQPSLKWPNDVFIGSRKVAGVLCESAGLGTPAPVVVVGIGLNVNMGRESLPTELRAIATSLAAEADRRFDRAELLAALLLELEGRYAAITPEVPAALREEYGVYCSTLGRRVRVSLSEGQAIEGQAEAITEDGALQVLPDGARFPVTLRTGDVLYVR